MKKTKPPEKEVSRKRFRGKGGSTEVPLAKALLQTLKELLNKGASDTEVAETVLSTIQQRKKGRQPEEKSQRRVTFNAEPEWEGQTEEFWEDTDFPPLEESSSYRPHSRLP